MLSQIKSFFFPEEFVVDERPVLVYRPEEQADDDPSAGDDAQETVLSARARARIFGEIAGGDLTSQTANLLLEQARLAERARRLEMERPSDDEMGRFVKQALPFLDNFSHLLEMARENPPSEEVDNWLKGVESLYFRIVNIFESFGLRFINSVGKPVDLNFQEVVQYRPSNMHPHDTVIKELQKGVVYKDRLIRDAKVVVAYNE